MAEKQSSTDPSSTEPPEGISMLDKTGEHLEPKPDEQLPRDSHEPNKNTTALYHLSDETIAEYLAHLSPIQQKYYDDLRGLGWDDASIHYLLTLLQTTREDIRIHLRMNGKSDAEIERLDALCDAETTDYSYMKRPLDDRAEERYQTDLYLYKEVKRQNRVMLGLE